MSGKRKGNEKANEKATEKTEKKERKAPIPATSRERVISTLTRMKGAKVGEDAAFTQSEVEQIQSLIAVVSGLDNGNFSLGKKRVAGGKLITVGSKLFFKDAFTGHYEGLLVGPVTVEGVANARTLECRDSNGKVAFIPRVHLTRKAPEAAPVAG